jgi:phage terminase small subunit
MKKHRRMKRRISKPRAYKTTKNGAIDRRSIGQGTELSPKHRQVISNYTDPNSPTQGNATQSAIKAGYSPISAHDTGSKILKRPETERELTRIFEAAGVTTEKLAKRVKQALDAKETKVFLCQKDGELVYSKKMIAHDIRLKAIRLAGEFVGAFAPKEINVKVAVLATRIQAARRREYERAPQQVVVAPSDKEPEPVTPTE